MMNMLRVSRMILFGLMFFAGSAVVAQTSAPAATPAHGMKPTRARRSKFLWT